MADVWMVWGRDGNGRCLRSPEVFDSEDGARREVERNGVAFRRSLGDWRTEWDVVYLGVPVGTLYIDRVPVHHMV